MDIRLVCVGFDVSENKSANVRNEHEITHSPESSP